MLIPKPFTTIVALGGPAVSVPPKVSREQIDEYIGIVEDRMATLQSYADRILAGRRGERDPAGHAPPSSRVIPIRISQAAGWDRGLRESRVLHGPSAFRRLT